MTTATKTSLTVTRLLAASPQRVFEAWTRPEELMQWSSPEGADVEHAEVDLVVGGAYLIRMRNAEGVTHTAYGVYREIDSPRRLVYTWDWKEADLALGEETLVTVEFLPRGDGTEVVLTHEGFPGAEATSGHEEGWTSALDRIVRYLS